MRLAERCPWSGRRRRPAQLLSTEAGDDRTRSARGGRGDEKPDERDGAMPNGWRPGPAEPTRSTARPHKGPKTMRTGASNAAGGDEQEARVEVREHVVGEGGGRSAHRRVPGEEIAEERPGRRSPRASGATPAEGSALGGHRGSCRRWIRKRVTRPPGRRPGRERASAAPVQPIGASRSSRTQPSRGQGPGDATDERSGDRRPAPILRTRSPIQDTQACCQQA